METRTLLGRIFSFLAGIALLCASAIAQDYPRKPIRWVTPYPPGGSTTFVSRLIGDKLAESFGGGGHKAAAGAFVPGSLAEAQPKVLDAVRAAMQ